jgi:ribosome-binding protein aMBF1 (putative translation factor)
MVKYFITIALMGGISTVFYQQPSCVAANQVHKKEKAPYEAFGTQLKRERIAHQIDNQVFAKKIGVSVEQLRIMEAGQKLPSKEQLYKMEDILSVTLLID